MFVCRKGAVLAAALAAILLFFACASLSAAGEASAQRALYTIVLDAGHGGADPGVLGAVSRVKESDVNLKIVQNLQELFADAGFRVVLTRKNAGGLYGLPTQGYKRRDMEQRREIIVGERPDIVISVHQNSFPAALSRRGGQVFFCAGREEDEKLADSIQSRLNGLSGKNYAALAGDFFVLNCAQAPAVLVECGFLSNAEDEALLVTEEYRQKVAYAIFKGTLAWLS